MTTILVDHNLEGQARKIQNTIDLLSWGALCPIRFLTLAEAGLPTNCSDRALWQFCQRHRMVLFTTNRNMKGRESLEDVLRAENAHTSLPVLTVGNAQRLDDLQYREACAARIIEIVLDLDLYLGAARLYVP